MVCKVVGKSTTVYEEDKVAKKPKQWPAMAHGEGSWLFDEERQKIVLRFMIDRKRVSVLGQSTTECMAKRDAKRAVARESKEARTRLGNADATVGEMLEAWFAFLIGNDTKQSKKKKNKQPGDKAPSTTEGYRRSIITIMSTKLAGMLARNVTLGDVERMYVELVATDRFGQASLIKVRTHLAMGFDHGVRHGYSTLNPVRGSKFPGNVRRPEKPTWLNGEQFEVMRSYLGSKGGAYRGALLLILLTGMRPGEVLALQWDAVDLDAGTVEVKRGLQRSMGGRVTTVVDEVKTEGSKRMLSVPADGVAVLRQMRREHPFGLVFEARDGRPLRFDVLRTACRKACLAIGVEMLPPNKLRHTNASVLLDRGQSLADVAQHLGHDDMRMVMTTYGHAMRSRIDTSGVLGDGAVSQGVS